VVDGLAVAGEDVIKGVNVEEDYVFQEIVEKNKQD
jgi:hypothetical protein